MNTLRYIEINSTYRDRYLWPMPGEFEVLISQTGRKNKKYSIDPVSLSMPLFSWSSNNFKIGGGSTINLIVENTKPIQYTSDQLTFIVSTTDQLQQLKNYYNGLVLIDKVTGTAEIKRRIIDYTYLDSYIDGGITKYRAQITVFNSYPESFKGGDQLTISDPTDFSDPYYPILFVPNSIRQENAYNTYILYNETINQYRNINSFELRSSLLTLYIQDNNVSTDVSGPIDNILWNTTDNFSIRKIPPLLPLPGTNNTLQISVLTSTLVVISDPSSILSKIKNYYKNQFLRILPYVSPADYKYNFNPIPINNEARRIVYYEYDIVNSRGIFKIYPWFTSNPEIGTYIEILPFSYDNLNPFVYSGSLVSSRELTCYEIQLISLTLPNTTLSIANGGRIAYYTHVYVQLSNISSTGGALKNIVYSNDPNATNIIFRAPIYDTQNPINSHYVKINGDGMIQTIKFKPNDNLYFKVTLPNGEIYNTNLEEYYSPAEPNPKCQISALFSIRKI
jgi:hypothetical protein